MRAWRFTEFGDIQNLKIAEYPDPIPADGEALVKLEFAALNPADRLLVEGEYPGAGALPLTVGRDGSGTVVRAPAASTFREGDPVMILRSPVGVSRQGTLAQLVTVPVESLAPLPDGWTFEQGAAGSVVYLTAWKALVVQGGYRVGETVLVNGASGGVGVAAIQLAKALGAKVVALSRDEAKRRALQSLGADIAIDAALPHAQIESAIKAALSGGGADIVIENLGGPFLQLSVNACNTNGRIMVIGLLAGRTSELQLGLVLFKQVRIEGVHVGQFTPQQAQDAWRNLVATLDKAGARPVVDRVYPFGEVQQAFEHLAGNHIGKVLVRIE